MNLSPENTNGRSHHETVTENQTATTHHRVQRAGDLVCGCARGFRRDGRRAGLRPKRPQTAPEGFIYVSGRNPGFTNDSLLVSEYQSGAIATYVVDATGDPITTTRRLFVTGLSGAEGAAVDPLTGDFLFSTFSGGNHVVAIRGFAAPPQRIPLDIQRLTNEVWVSWSATPTNWVLEFTADIVGPWTNDPTTPSVQNGTNSILKAVNDIPRFWRLRYQP